MTGRVASRSRVASKRKDLQLARVFKSFSKIRWPFFQNPVVHLPTVSFQIITAVAIRLLTTFWVYSDLAPFFISRLSRPEINFRTATLLNGGARGPLWGTRPPFCGGLCRPQNWRGPLGRGARGPLWGWGGETPAFQVALLMVKVLAYRTEIRFQSYTRGRGLSARAFNPW